MATDTVEATKENRKEKKVGRCLTLRLRRPAKACGQGAGPLELPHLVPEGGSEPVPGLVDDERGQAALTVVLGDDPGELLPLDWAAGSLVRLEEHVAHHVIHQLALLLQDRSVRQNVEHPACTVRRGRWGARTSLEMSICASSSLVAIRGARVGEILSESAR